MQPHIALERVSKVFGPRPEKALDALARGIGKAELRAASGNTVALQDVSLAVDQGEIAVVMGLSGSGKSTLIRLVNRLIDPTAGRVVVGGADITALRTGELPAFRRGRIGMVFQRFGLLPHRTVIANVAYGLELEGVGRRDRERRAERWIAAVGLDGYESAYPHELSGGMQQRVGLARALAPEPQILLMDEAFSALDPLIRGEMQDLLLMLHAELRQTVLFVTHDLDEALRLGHRIAIMKDGRVLQHGAPAEILLQPADDHVRAFVKDVNRWRALTVEAVMKPPVLRLQPGAPREALAEMRRRAVELGYLVESGRFRGIVRRDRIQASLAGGGGGATLSDLAEQVRSLPARASLERALAETFDTDLPLPVVDDEGALRGVVSREELRRVFAAEGTPPAENAFRFR